MKNKNYKELYQNLSKEQINLLSEKHYDLRERYLMYSVTGAEHVNSVENALFDVFEGDDDIQDEFPNIEEDQNIIDFCSLTLKFSSPEEMLDILQDETVQISMIP